MPSVSATSPVEQMAPVASAATMASALGRILKALTYPSRFRANAHWVHLFCWRRRMLPLGDSVTPRAVRLTSNPVQLWGAITQWRAGRSRARSCRCGNFVTAQWERTVGEKFAPPSRPLALLKPRNSQRGRSLVKCRSFVGHLTKETTAELGPHRRELEAVQGTGQGAVGKSH